MVALDKSLLAESRGEGAGTAGNGSSQVGAKEVFPKQTGNGRAGQARYVPHTFGPAATRVCFHLETLESGFGNEPTPRRGVTEKFCLHRLD
jgi:hypothetical protein